MRDYLRHVQMVLDSTCAYTLLTWDTGRRDRRGQTTIGYRLSDPDGVDLFEGEDFNGSPMHADDSDDNLRALMGFLTLKPGDTDCDYFDNYTPNQLAWCTGSDCETLVMWTIEDPEWEPWLFEDVPFPEGDE